MKALIVEKDKLKKNLALIHERAGGAEIIGVLKGNGYGLGLLELARAVREEGVSRFAVTEPADARRLRGGGFADEEILILRSTAVHEEIDEIFDACATASIGSYDAAVALNGMAKERGMVVDAHLIVDTGMGRYGFLPSETDRILSVFRFMESINITGVYTHFYAAFASEKATLAQYTALASVVDAIREAGFDPGMVHAANSAALFRYKLQPLDAVRVGSAITGRVAGKGNHGLFRVGRLQAPVIEIRWVPKGQTVGYGGAYVAKRPTRIAIVPLGYGDGYLVERAHDIYRFRDMARYCLGEIKKWLTSRIFTVSLNGKRVRVLGHVGLAHTALDVTEIECAVGDLASFDVSPLMVDSAIPRVYE